MSEAIKIPYKTAILRGILKYSVELNSERVQYRLLAGGCQSVTSRTGKHNSPKSTRGSKSHKKQSANKINFTRVKPQKALLPQAEVATGRRAQRAPVAYSSKNNNSIENDKKGELWGLKICKGIMN